MSANCQRLITLGQTLGRPPHRRFGILPADRLLHQYIVGQTGTGKSTLLANLMRQDAKQGQDFCLIDPHGDLSEDIASELGDQAIIWNAADPDCPYGYNPLTPVTATYRPLVASGVIDTLKQQWSDAWGARMEHLLRYALLTLLEQPQATFQNVLPLFLDKSYRELALQHVIDEEVLRFWRQEYTQMRYQTSMDSVAPIANKIGSFLAHPVTRAKSDPNESGASDFCRDQRRNLMQSDRISP